MAKSRRRCAEIWSMAGADFPRAGLFVGVLEDVAAIAEAERRRPSLRDEFTHRNITGVRLEGKAGVDIRDEAAGQVEVAFGGALVVAGQRLDAVGAHHQRDALGPDEDAEICGEVDAVTEAVEANARPGLHAEPARDGV